MTPNKKRVKLPHTMAKAGWDVLIGRDDVRTELAEQPGDRRDDPVPVGAGDQEARVVGQPVGMLGHRPPNRSDSG